MSTDGLTDGRTDEPITIVPFDLRRGTKTILVDIRPEKLILCRNILFIASIAP